MAASLLRVALVLAILFSSAYGTQLAGAEKVEQLSPQGYVNDFAGVIDANSRQRIAALCEELDQKADTQLAVVTIHTLEGDTAQDFANRLFEKWGVGPKGKDRGVMVLLAVDDHKYWTEVGYGLEPILPDGKVGGYGRQMLERLRQNQYGAALLQISTQIASTIAEDRGLALTNVTPAAAPTADSPEPSFSAIPPLLLNLLVLLLIFGGWRLLPFLFGLIIGSRYPRTRSDRDWWASRTGGWRGGMGGGGWGGGYGGGGGGGFGGFGGGASGGGGAGGGW